MPERDIRLNRELLRYRASLVKVQTGLKNRIQALLAKNNIDHDFSDLFGREGQAFLHSLTLHQVYGLALEGYLTVLSALQEQIARASQQIKASAQEDRGAKLLMSIPGVAYYSALLIRSEIGEVHLRWILLEVTLHAIKKVGPLQDFHGRTEKRKGQKVARVATCRKLLERIYQMLKEGKSFEEVERIAAGKGEPAITRSLKTLLSDWAALPQGH